MITLDAVGSKIKALDAMPTVPAIVQPLTSMLQLHPEEIEIEEVVKLVSYDSTIAAQCLRMANSPLLGRKNTETIRSAVMALGLKRVEAILLGCCLNNIMPADKWALDVVTFWRHALGCALVSPQDGIPDRLRGSRESVSRRPAARCWSAHKHDYGWGCQYCKRKRQYCKR